MEVKNCRGCGRLFNYIGGGYFLCPTCKDELEKKFSEVKQYIKDNPGATIPQISQEMEVSSNQIERWVREERLVFADDSAIGFECENCGASIKTGRYCTACKSKMTNDLSSMYKTEPQQVERKKMEREKARMRFLDNQ